MTKTPIENCHPPLSDSGHQRLGHRFIPRTDDDPARAEAVNHLCHCHPVTEQALRREIVDLAAEYYRVDRAWLTAQLQAWELEYTASAGLMARNGMAAGLASRENEILRKLRDKCRALGMRSQK